MGRRIVPLPQDDLQQDYGGVAPTRRSLKRTMHIIEAEARLEQKGWRVRFLILDHRWRTLNLHGSDKTLTARLSCAGGLCTAQALLFNLAASGCGLSVDVRAVCGPVLCCAHSPVQQRCPQ